MRITFSKGGDAFNPVTGFSTTDSGFTYPITSIAPYGENRIAKLRSNFKRNRTTTLTGSLFSTSGSASFSVETGWEEGIERPF